jgi:DNA polymerase III delta subunit
MLYLFYGTNIDASRAKLRKTVEVLTGKKPDASVSYIDDEAFDPGALETLVAGQGLFEAKQIVVFRNVFRNKEAKELLLAERKALAESQNIFFLLEGVIDKAALEKLKKVTERAECSGEEKAEKKRETEFNRFALADALGKRDRKALWVLLLRARRARIAEEEIHGLLFWQVKNMLLARESKSADEAGLNPFVYKKAASFSKNYSESELAKLSQKLVELYHDAHRGRHEFGIALERFALGL